MQRYERRNKRLYLIKGACAKRSLLQRIKRIRLDTIRAKLVGMVVVAGAR